MHNHRRAAMRKALESAARSGIRHLEGAGGAELLTGLILSLRAADADAKKPANAQDDRIADSSGQGGLTPLQKMCFAAGAAAAPIGLAATLAAIRSRKDFKWTKNTISYLLEGGNPPLSASLAASGVLTSAFAYGLSKSRPQSRAYEAGTALLSLGGLALSGAGLIPPPSRAHFNLAATYFIAAPSAMLLMAVPEIRNGHRASGVLAAVAGTVALGVILTGHLSKRMNALEEFVATAAIGSWIFSCSLGALLRDGKSG